MTARFFSKTMALRKQPFLAHDMDFNVRFTTEIKAKEEGIIGQKYKD